MPIVNFLLILWAMARKHALIILAATLLCLLQACGEKQMSENVIAQSGTFTLTGDSVTQGGIYAYAPSPDQIISNITTAHLDSLYHNVDSGRLKFTQGVKWRAEKSRPYDLPQYESGQPLIDALYNMATDNIHRLNGPGHFEPQHNLSRLYCSIYLSLAYLCPQSCINTLRSLVDRDSIIMQTEGAWPIVSDHLWWVAAAWEVYKASGDSAWLNYSYHVVRKTMEIDSEVLLDVKRNLMHGTGYTAPSTLRTPQHSWMTGTSLFSCMSLGNNILAVHAYEILDEMCDELGIESNYEQKAQRIKDAINQYLWNEDRGCYSAFIYGVAYPVQAPTSDNTSQALSIIWDIANDDRGEFLIAHTPVSDCGVSVTFPPQQPLEPYFTNISWSTTQALWNIAATHTANDNALRRGLGALFRAHALYLSQGISVNDSQVGRLEAGAATTAMMFRVLTGMRFTPDGIEFSPNVPIGMDTEKRITRFRYRNALLNITLHGVGNDIGEMTLDGKRVEGDYLPATLQGEHDVVIHLKGGHRGTQRVTLHQNEVLLPPTPLVVWSNDSGHIVNPASPATYRLLINGKPRQDITDSVFALPKDDEFAVYALIYQGNHVQSYTSNPYRYYPFTPLTLLLPEDNDSISLKVSVEKGGTYLLNIGYDPTGNIDVRHVIVNTHPMGTLVMADRPNAAPTPAGSSLMSSMVEVDLLKGSNTIVIKQLRLPWRFRSCLPRFVTLSFKN